MGKFDFTIRKLRTFIGHLIDEECHINDPDNGKNMKEISEAIDYLEKASKETAYQTSK